MATTINLTSSATGARILFATDEWFATADNLLKPNDPEFIPDLYCEQGKVMDGWETRRKRSAGHDWCIIKLGGGASTDDSSATFQVESMQVDTAFFTGNQTPRISIEGMRVIDSSGDGSDDYLYTWMPGAVSRLARGGGTQGTGQTVSTIQKAADACKNMALKTTKGMSGDWIEILPMTPLKPGYEESRYHSFSIEEAVKLQVDKLGGITHLKVNYFPDGGVARLKVMGQVVQSTSRSSLQKVADGNLPNKSNKPAPFIHPHSSRNPPPSSKSYLHPELSCSSHGGLGLECSNKHYGIPMNLTRPTLGNDMGDGWETARHPDRPPVVTKDPVTGLQDTPLSDWCVLKLGCGGATDSGVSRIIVDTRHFKGNFPESVKIDGCCETLLSDEVVCASAGSSGEESSIEWFPLLNRVALVADAEHEFTRDAGLIENGSRKVTHVRVSIYPDGGLSRVRVYGEPLQVERAPMSHL